VLQCTSIEARTRIQKQPEFGEYVMTLILKKSLDQRDNSHLSPVDFEVIRYGVGIDVHKFKLAVCVKAQLATGELVEIKEHIFLTTPQALNELCQFLQKFRPLAHILMECTGVYHRPIYQALCDTFPEDQSKIVAMNPLLLNRRISDLGSHSDKVDARALANIAFYDSLIRPSYVGTAYFFEVRDFIRSYHKSRIHVSRLRCRIHRNLDCANFRFVFDFSRDWHVQLLEYFIREDWKFITAYEQLIKDREQNNQSANVLKKNRDILIPYASLSLSATQRFQLQLELTRMIAATYLRKAETEVIDNPKLSIIYQRLCVMPGFGPVSSLTILLELGDYTRFTSWEAMAKFCGVIPKIHESGEMKAKGHINRHSNKYLRGVLYQVAGVLINRSRRDSDLTEFAYRQSKVRGLPYKKALMKVAQKLVRVVYQVLINHIAYNPTHEQQQRKQMQQANLMARQRSLLSTKRLRPLKHDIQDFLVTHYEFTNSSSRYHLKQGFHRILQKAKEVKPHRLQIKKKRTQNL